MMKKTISLVVSIIFLIFTLSCSSSRTLAKDDTLEQQSVRITLNDGSENEGIVLKQTPAEIVYIDAKTHEKQTINTSLVKSIRKSDYVYDFSGNAMPDAEISKYKGAKKTMLYGAGGLLLGAAVGVGAGLMIVSADTSAKTLAQVTIGAFAVGGAVYFGLMGSDADYEDAVFAARMARYDKEKLELEAEKKELEKLKKEKEELIKKKEAGKR